MLAIDVKKNICEHFVHFINTRSKLLCKSIFKHIPTLFSQLDTEEEAHWVVPAVPGGGGCTVLLEADPPPGTAIGHMSFSAFNPAIEKLHVRGISSACGATSSPALVIAPAPRTNA